jgi:surface carbohydrate biosynthesis protein
LKVALIVDNPFRDLPGLTLVARHLVAKGIRVFLVPMNLQQWELFALAPDYVLVNYCRKNNEELIGRLQRVGIRVGVLDTEGGVLSSFDSYEQTLATNKSVRDSISSFMTWGPRLAEHAASAGWFRPDQLVVTGSPRFDFYNEKWRPVALELSELPPDMSTPLVMFNGNFPLANPQFSSRAEERTRLVKEYGYLSEDVEQWQSAQAAGMAGLTELANTLAERFPSVSFVYRPHPFENIDAYADLISPRRNLKLIRRGTVDTWILQSTAVIQRSCSTAIEAAMSGRAALSPSWLPTAREMPSANAVSYQCSTPNEMSLVLTSLLDGSFVEPPEIRAALSKVVEDWFADVEGRAAERVSERIVEDLPKSPVPNLGGRARRALYGLDATLRQKLAGTTRMIFGMDPSRSFRPAGSGADRWGQSEKFFGVKEVKRIATAIDRAAREPGSVCLKVSDAVATDANESRYFVRSVVVAPDKR